MVLLFGLLYCKGTEKEWLFGELGRTREEVSYAFDKLCYIATEVIMKMHDKTTIKTIDNESLKKQFFDQVFQDTDSLNMDQVSQNTWLFNAAQLRNKLGVPT